MITLFVILTLAALFVCILKVLIWAAKLWIKLSLGLVELVIILSIILILF